MGDPSKLAERAELETLYGRIKAAGKKIIDLESENGPHQEERRELEAMATRDFRRFSVGALSLNDLKSSLEQKAQALEYLAGKLDQEPGEQEG